MLQIQKKDYINELIRDNLKKDNSEDKNEDYIDKLLINKPKPKKHKLEDIFLR